MAETQTKEKTYSFSVEGMTCASCVHIVERQLSKMEGIKYVSVNLATEKAYVISEPDKSFTDIQNTVEKTGYKAKKSEKGTDQTLVRFQKTQMDLIIALAITIPVMGLMIAHMTGVMIPGYLFVEILGGLAIFLTAGRGIVKSAGIALVHGHTNMDSLVSLGSFAAFLTAVLAAAGVDIASFGALAPMLIAFHMAGKYIEARLKYRASKDVRSLLDIQSKNARIATRDKGIVEMPLETVKPGAVCVVRTGERIPLDGKIIEGKGYTDESMITGEPVPVEKQKEDEVTGGTLLTSGSIRFEVTHVGEDTFLARMVKLVEEAQSAKVPIQAAADRVTLIFIPLVMTIAVIAGLFWGIGYDAFAPFLSWAQGFLPWVNPDAGALSTGIFVFVTALVIACPCALGLATPMGLVAGTGAAAKRGMIIKEGEAIQRAKDISTVVFDKTGTLTKGEPEVVESNADNEHLPIIAAIEAQSAHPLARA
ncbi:MAG: heavy metal translocating P-type ATPase, partial [Spirochaetia bacterium]